MERTQFGSILAGILLSTALGCGDDSAESTGTAADEASPEAGLGNGVTSDAPQGDDATTSEPTADPVTSQPVTSEPVSSEPGFGDADAGEPETGAPLNSTPGFETDAAAMPTTEPSEETLADAATAALDAGATTTEPAPTVSVPLPPIGLSDGGLGAHRLDLLFVVDNSHFMASKHAVLADAVPYLLERLATPPCVPDDAAADALAAHLDPLPEGNTCPEGTQPAFTPVTDLHVGIISSSLGPRGVTEADAAPGFNCNAIAQQDDRAWLLGRARSELNAGSFEGYGFLAWTANADADSVDAASQSALLAAFTQQLSATGEAGCGFEAPLEAAYRFLSDPDPYASVVRGPCPGQASGTLCAQLDGLDEDLLAQRDAFLRPDSVVAVVYLTDENDCSVRTRGQGYLVMAQASLDGATRACDEDPNSECCLPCGVALREGCPSAAENGCDEPSPDSIEAYRLRCFEQQRRFGVNLLRSTDVYVGGFVFPQVATREDSPASNPLFTEWRDRDQIFVLGIVGTPWQDTATAETLTSPTELEVRTGKQLDWSLFLGEEGQVATDPYNVESVVPRTGSHPLTGDALGEMGTWNAINGHELPLAPNDEIADDLQAACIFELPEPKPCSANDEVGSCACVDPPLEGELGYDVNPACYSPADEQYATAQRFATAAPSPRLYEVLHGVACPPDPVTGEAEACTDQAILSSICPKQLGNSARSDYGYRPAMRALLSRIAPRFAP